MGIIRFLKKLLGLWKIKSSIIKKIEVTDLLKQKDLGNIANFQYHQPFTLECVCSSSNKQVGMIIANITPRAESGYQWFFSNGQLYFFLRSDQEMISCSSKKKIADGQLHQLVITYNGNGKASGFNMYIDKKKLAVVRAGKKKLQHTTVNNDNVTLGSWRNKYKLEGDLKKFSYYKKELKLEEIQLLQD